MKHIAAARARILQLAEQFGTLGIQYSGGKDSDALLHLACSTLPAPPPAAFHDPEFIHPSTANHAAEVMTRHGGIIIQTPTPTQIGNTGEIITAWKSGAEHLRLRHPDAVTYLPPYAHWAETFTLALLRHQPNSPLPICWLNGTRTAEGYSRRTALIRRRHFVFANSPHDYKAWVIHDWSEAQVLDYISKNKITISPEYQLLADAGVPPQKQRTGIDIEDTRSDTLAIWKDADPDYYAALIKRVPQLAERTDEALAKTPPSPHLTWHAALIAALKNPPHGKTEAIAATGTLLRRHRRAMPDAPVPDDYISVISGISNRWLYLQITRNASGSKMIDNSISAAIKANNRTAHTAGISAAELRRLIQHDPPALARIQAENSAPE